MIYRKIIHICNNGRAVSLAAPVNLLRPSVDLKSASSHIGNGLKLGPLVIGEFDSFPFPVQANDETWQFPNELEPVRLRKSVVSVVLHQVHSIKKA